MNGRNKLMLDYVNMVGKMVVNRSGCFSISRTPELKWLIKKGHLTQYRKPAAGGISYTVLKPTEPRKVDKVYCPCCKVDMSDHGAMWQMFVKGTSEYFSVAKHALNCSMRIDHFYDGMRKHVKK